MFFYSFILSNKDVLSIKCNIVFLTQEKEFNVIISIGDYMEYKSVNKYLDKSKNSKKNPIYGFFIKIFICLIIFLSVLVFLKHDENGRYSGIQINLFSFVVERS